MSKIAMVLPTRNRPEKLTRFINSVFSTAEDPSNVKFYFYVDSDDVVTMPCLEKVAQTSLSKFLVHRGPRIMMSQTANMLIPSIEEDIFFLGADDLVFKTQGWDTLVIDFFETHQDKVVLAYGNDLFNSSLATHPIIHRRWVEAVGYLTPPYFEADFADTWLTDLARKIGGRIQLLDFVNEHMHFYARKSELDSTFAENRQRYAEQDPDLVYRCLDPVRARDAQKLLQVIGRVKNA